MFRIVQMKTNNTVFYTFFTLRFFCLKVAQKILYAKRIFVSLSKITSVKVYQRKKTFQRTSKKQKNVWQAKILRYV